MFGLILLQKSPDRSRTVRISCAKTIFTRLRYYEISLMTNGNRVEAKLYLIRVVFVLFFFFYLPITDMHKIILIHIVYNNHYDVYVYCVYCVCTIIMYERILGGNIVPDRTSISRDRDRYVEIC